VIKKWGVCCKEYCSRVRGRELSCSDTVNRARLHVSSAWKLRQRTCCILTRNAQRNDFCWRVPRAWGHVIMTSKARYIAGGRRWNELKFKQVLTPTPGAFEIWWFQSMFLSPRALCCHININVFLASSRCTLRLPLKCLYYMHTCVLVSRSKWKFSCSSSLHNRNFYCLFLVMSKTKQTPWSESASELYRPSDLRLSAKLVPTFADRGCHVISVTDLYGRILGFEDKSRYFSIK
jgi:hypothetical protein